MSLRPQNLDLAGMLDDACLERPGPIRALLDAADEAVVRALPERGKPVLTEAVRQGEARGEARGKVLGEAAGRAEGEARHARKSLLQVLEARGVALTADQRARIEGGSASRSLDQASLGGLEATPPRAARATTKNRRPSRLA